MEQIQQAKLVVHWKNSDETEIEFEINPTEISLDKSAQFAEINIPGLDSPLQQFVRGQAAKMNLELFFDSTDKGIGPTGGVSGLAAILGKGGAESVTKQTDRVFQLVKIEPEGHAPPRCRFVWNEAFPGAHLDEPPMASQRRHEFPCIVESVRQKFTYFNPEGIPLRATLTVVLREYRTLDEQVLELKLNSPDRTHTHALLRGETLSSLAARYYNRPAAWRTIAEHDANRIDDPRRLSAGDILTVPPLV